MISPWHVILLYAPQFIRRSWVCRVEYDPEIGERGGYVAVEVPRGSRYPINYQAVLLAEAEVAEFLLLPEGDRYYWIEDRCREARKSARARGMTSP